MDVAQRPKIEQDKQERQDDQNKQTGQDTYDWQDEQDEQDEQDQQGEEDEQEDPNGGPAFDRRYYGLSFLFYEPTDDTPPATTYQYKPLDASKQEVRYMLVVPGKYEDDIVIALMHEQFDNLPFYFALSYVWGSEENPQPVYVRECSAPDYEEVDPKNNIIMVTRNLDIALRHLRHPTLVLPIWIDAICIDQQNMAERSQQVAFMCELYRKAGETYVWIGPEENYSNDVMDWIDLIGLISEVNWSTETMYNSKDYKNVGRKNADIFDVSLTWETDWFVTLRSICHLANRDYFTRLWVRQEVKMSQCKWLVCGNQRVPWQPFSNFARWMAVKPLIVQDPYANWTEQLDKRYKAGASMILSLCKGALELTVTTFDRLRFDNTNLQWKDPRDAIYANLGMLAPECRQLGIVPDYDKDPADIFTDVAVRVATKLHSLGFLESCDIDSIDLENLPTWVPDWSSPLKIDPGMENIWSSSAWISAQVEYLGDGVMVANGVAVSEVESVHYWEGDRPYEGQPYMVCDCIRYWCDLKPSDYDEHQESYLEGSNLTWLEAWCTLFLYGNLIDVFKAGQESEVDRPDLMSLQEAKEMFLIILRARSFHEIWCLDDPMWRRMDRFLSKIGNRMKGRVVFKTVNGHIGVAPASIWRGSMVSVLLGCDVPVILWPLSDGSSTDERERWQVFSSCFVVGLMDGEAITGPLPKNCRTVDWRFREDLSSDHKINRLQSGIFNEQEGTLETDPAKVLQDRGIPCIRYERQPHLLEVSPEALRNAGVELRRFVLV